MAYKVQETITLKQNSKDTISQENNFCIFNQNKNCNNNSDSIICSNECYNDCCNDDVFCVENDTVLKYLDEVEHLMSLSMVPKEVTYVRNLSSYRLSDSEMSLLNKGLKYCPTPPRPDIGNIIRDVETFFRKASTLLFFHGNSDHPNDTSSSQSTQYQDVSPLKPFQHKDLKLKSTWNAPVPPLLEHVKQLTLSEIQNSNIKPCRYKNLKADEFKAINSLFTNNDIVIKPADKGSGIVILNRDDYIKEGERQLDDTTFYKSTDTDLTQKHFRQVKEVVDQMFDNDEITNKTYQYLISNCDRTPQFYMLPKIHKSLQNPPGRPIISGNDSPTEKISHLIDVILQPFVSKVRSYIKDTTHFLQKINDLDISGHEDIILCTLDVTYLYTNIPHKEGIDVVRKLLEKERPNAFLPTKNSILKLLELVLTKNNFDFNGKHYLQVNGTAMGTRVAPTYANLFMADFEDKHVYTYPLQPLVWFRYIDDCNIIWTHGEQELIKFVEHLNSVHESIKFTSEYSRVKVNFLDTTLKYDKITGLTTDLYVKPTDTQSYLRYDSCHPQHIKNSLPYSQFLRLRRICSDRKDYVLHSLQMIRSFTHRGYPLTKLLDNFNKVYDIARNDLLNESEQITQDTLSQNPNKLFCITEYNPSNPPIKEIIMKHWPILGRSSATRPIVDAQIIFGNRQPQNLKDKLIRARLPATDPTVKKTWPTCQRPTTCKHCPRIDKTGQIVSNSTKRKFKCIFNACCKSKNLIYCITCKVCGLQYVGQTITPIMTRVNNHLSTIRTRKDTPLARHMNSHDPSKQFDITVHVLEFIRAPIDSHRAKLLRDQTERDWMARLHTLVPHGLNLQE